MRFHRNQTGRFVLGPRSGGLSAAAQRRRGPGSVCADGRHGSVAERIAGGGRLLLFEAPAPAAFSIGFCPWRRGVPAERRNGLLFEWAYPQVARLVPPRRSCLPSALSGRGDQRRAAAHTAAALLDTSEVVSRQHSEWGIITFIAMGLPSRTAWPERPAATRGQEPDQRAQAAGSRPPSKTTKQQPTARMCSSRAIPRRSALAGTSANQSRVRHVRAEQKTEPEGLCGIVEAPSDSGLIPPLHCIERLGGLALAWVQGERSSRRVAGSIHYSGYGRARVRAKRAEITQFGEVLRGRDHGRGRSRQLRHRHQGFYKSCFHKAAVVSEEKERL